VSVFDLAGETGLPDSDPSCSPESRHPLVPLLRAVVLEGVVGQVLVKLLLRGLQNQLTAQFSQGTRVLEEITKLCLKAWAQKK